MEWEKLLSTKRVGSLAGELVYPKRSPFQKDYDRIIFSAPFRRLQDKAQVFPLNNSNFIRTRLTHSLETSTVGRTLGNGVGDFVCKKFKLNNIIASDFGTIVAAATLAHDIGNPPLGHAGEEAVQNWFKKSLVAQSCKGNMSVNEIADINKYEGNAQGFRVLTKLQQPSNYGGMQLTCATLGAFLKYPTISNVMCKAPGVNSKKYGVFSLEKELFLEVANSVGLKQYDDYSFCRHPLAFMVEAADDIAYKIVDLEDGFFAGRVSYKETEELLFEIIKSKKHKMILNNLYSEQEKVEYLRSKVIGKLVDETIDEFIKHHDVILAGNMTKSLIDYIPASKILNEIHQKAKDCIYTTPRVIEISVAGFELLSGILDIFVEGCNDIAINGEKASPNSKRLMYLLPNSEQYMRESLWLKSPYLRIMNVLDYITSLSDFAALSLHKKLKGISL